MDGPSEDAKGAPASKTTETRSDAADDPDPARFPPDEEAALLQESHSIKADANALFSSHDYHSALARYDDALASCPRYLVYHRAVLHSNIAACHLKLEQWKEAIKAATAALDALVEFEKQDDDLPAADAAPETSAGEHRDASKSDAASASDAEEQVIVSAGALRCAPPPPSAAEARKAHVLRIRTKALLRRARARSEAGGWQNLAGAEDDYRTLAAMPGLGPADARTVRAQLKVLPPRTKAAQESEMADMWGKLRQLGDGILKPFGLSTNNFQMVKDEKTGRYSVNFTQGGPSSS